MTFGFIVLRHVNSESTNRYWNQCVKLLRCHYPEQQIVIIDDNSNYDFVKAEFDYKNVEIIQSEYPGIGELLPYIYYARNKWFDDAVFIHDSVFFHTTYDFLKIINNTNSYNVYSLWYFVNMDSGIDNILRISDLLNNNNDIKKHISEWYKHEWRSCFGVMSLINYNFLKNIIDKYNLTILLDIVINRHDRCALERIMGVIFYLETGKNNDIFGCINENNKKSKLCDYTYDEYIQLFRKNNILSSVVKVWTGR